LSETIGANVESRHFSKSIGNDWTKWLSPGRI